MSAPVPIPVSIMDDKNEPGTRILDLPVEMLAEVLDYLTLENRQKLRAVCPVWNHIIGQLFETSLFLNSCNWEALMETSARFLHVNITRTGLDHQLNGFVNLESFCSRIQKLELRALKLDLSCLRLLQYAVSLKELIITGVHYWPLPDGLKLEEFQRDNDLRLPTWLPELKSMKFEASNHELLKVLSIILEKGGLENLAVGSNCLFSEVVMTLFGMTSSWILPGHNVMNDLITKIITCNKKTLKKLASGRYSALDFNPRSTKEFYLRKFRGALWFRPGGVVETTRSRSWLHILQNQERLEELDLECFQFDVPELVQAESLRFEDFSSDLIIRSGRHMTRISLQFGATKEFLDPIFAQSLDHIFSKCYSLKHLKLGLYTPSTWDQYDRPRTWFRGITTLPQSLRSFQTSFPIFSEANSIDELELPNLTNLESLDLISNIWFIFKDTPIKSLSLNQLKQFSSRLPKLKTINLNVAYTKMETMSGCTGNLKIIDRELVKKFRDSLQHKKYQGIFLKVETSQL